MSRPEEVLLRVYGRASLSEIARQWSIEDGDPAEALGALWGDKKDRKKIVEDLPEDQRGLLAFMDGIGRRLRGERLKKRWFLHGYDDFDERVMPLVDRGLVLVGNKDAREAVSLQTALEQGLMQQWLQVTPGFEGFAGKQPEARKVVESVEDDTRSESLRRLCVVEFNLLNAVRFVEVQRIRLNRDASPHRSDLKNMAIWLIDPENAGVTGSVTPDPLNVYGWDTHIVTLSLAEALGMIERRGDSLAVIPSGMAYFAKPMEERVQMLLRAIEQQRAWSELEAVSWFAYEQPPQTGQGHGAFLEHDERGSVLAGPRGSVISALRRLRRLGPADWFDVEETVRTIASLEKDYIDSSLPVVAGISGEPVIEDFVNGVITRALFHVGAVELGRSTKGKVRARLTAIGRRIIDSEEPLVEVDGAGAIVVEPSFEITCFIDMAPASLMYDISRFAELIETSERVVRYRLSGESVQWGYARGYTADSIKTILERAAQQPVPPSVLFALGDWERIHRRVTVYVQGDLIAAAGKSDPEVVQSGILFAIPGDGETEVVNDTFTFVTAGHPEEVERAMKAYRPAIIDYDGEIHPSLEWLDDQRLRAPRGATDLRILSRVDKLTVREEEDVLRIDPKRIRQQVGLPEGVRVLFSALRKAVAGGLAAEREFAVKKLLDQPATSHVEAMEVLVLQTAEDGDRVARVAALKEYIVERLGERAFRVVPGRAEALLGHLETLGVKVADNRR